LAKKGSAGVRPAPPERQAADVRVRVVEAQEFRLVDRTGKVRAALELTRAGPSLAMLHEDGTVALEIVLTGDGPGVRLADANGETRVFIGATRGAARMGMADGQGSQRLFLGVNSGGTPTISLYDREQRQVWTAATAKERALRPRRP